VSAAVLCSDSNIDRTPGDNVTSGIVPHAASLRISRQIGVKGCALENSRSRRRTTLTTSLHDWQSISGALTSQALQSSNEAARRRGYLAFITSLFIAAASPRSSPP